MDVRYFNVLRDVQRRHPVCRLKNLEDRLVRRSSSVAICFNGMLLSASMISISPTTGARAWYHKPYRVQSCARYVPDIAKICKVYRHKKSTLCSRFAIFRTNRSDGDRTDIADGWGVGIVFLVTDNIYDEDIIHFQNNIFIFICGAHHDTR